MDLIQLSDKELKAELKRRKEFAKCLCPRCIHFHVGYASWGVPTYCDRTGYWERQEYDKKICKDYKAK